MTDRNGSRAVRGAMTALVTPFRQGRVDWPCLEMLINRQLADGIDWLVTCGTTAETPTLSEDEGSRITEIALRCADNRCGVMAGTGCNDTRRAVAKTRAAAAAGAGAVLVVAPYYNRPPQEGLFRHFAAIAESVDLPIVLYNVPPRTGVSIGHEVVVRLRERFPHVVGIKHATGALGGVCELQQKCDIAILSGDDALNWPLMAVGAVGTISVVANLCPSLIKSQVDAALEGRLEDAGRLHRTVYDLAVELGRHGPNPIPIKTAMFVCGLIDDELRLPLCSLDADARRSIKEILRRHELLTHGARPEPETVS